MARGGGRTTAQAEGQPALGYGRCVPRRRKDGNGQAGSACAGANAPPSWKRAAAADAILVSGSSPLACGGRRGFRVFKGSQAPTFQVMNFPEPPAPGGVPAETWGPSECLLLPEEVLAQGRRFGLVFVV